MSSIETQRQPSPDRCPRCEGTLGFYLRTLPKNEGEAAHRIFRCEACSHFEWVAEPPGKRT